MENHFYSLLKGQLTGSLIEAVTSLFIERVMTVRQNTFISDETDGTNTWKRHSMLRETVATYEKAKPQHLERAMEACEKPHSALRNSENVRQQKIVKVHHTSNFHFVAGCEFSQAYHKM